MNEAIRVFLVEDQAAIRASLEQLLEASGRVRLVGAAESGEQALEALSACNPQVVLCDLGLPGISGIETTRRIKERHPAVEVLMFTVSDEETDVLAAIRAGASGYLLKGSPAARVVEALEDVRAGGTVIQPRLARSLLERFREAPDVDEGEKLTPREREILHLIARGLSNREAGEVLSLSPSTVRTHLEHIYEKLDVTNRVEAVTEGLRKGLIEV